MKQAIGMIVAMLAFTGCASVGTVMEVAGKASGNKNLASAGSGFKRQAEVQEFTEEEKFYTGRTVAADLLAGYELSENTQLEAYVGQVGQTVALASGKAELPQGWHFILLKGESPDAFAVPGGIIMVTEGLVKLCQDEDELAGVLAHEVSHVSIDHPTQAISDVNRNAALVSLAQYGYGEYAKKQGAGAQAMAGQFASVVKDVAKGVSHGYDRKKESEADLEAVRVLTELGYDPRGLKRVLAKLTKGDHSHGDPAQRAKDVEAAAYQAEPVPKTSPARTARFAAALGR
jgi:predicted Zn-dependent protease